jgi:hypothetical protein
MLAFELLAEKKIAEALMRGELDDLPGQGRPLELDDDPLVPEDLRVAYRILKNAGYVPPEIEALQAISALERLIDRTPDGEQRRAAVRKLDLLRAQLDRSRPGRGASAAQRQYRGLMLTRFGGLGSIR